MTSSTQQSARTICVGGNTQVGDRVMFTGDHHLPFTRLMAKAHMKEGELYTVKELVRAGNEWSVVLDGVDNHWPISMFTH